MPKLGKGLGYQTVNITAPASKTVVVKRDPNAATQFRVFYVNSTTTTTLTGITATGGRLFGGTTPAYYGGGIYVDDGSVLTLTRSTVTDCRVQGKGGGIYLSPDVVSFTMNSASVVEGCKADGNGGGIYMHGRSNTWAGDHLKITGQSEVRNNESVLGSGGGLYFDSWSGTADYRVRIDGNSKVNGNTAKLDGGGIYVAPNAQFDGTFTDIQVNDNRAVEGKGGSLFTGGKVVATRVNFQFNRGGSPAGYAVAVSTAARATPLELVSSGVTQNQYIPPGAIDPSAAAVDAGNQGIKFSGSVVLDNTYNGVRGTVVSTGGNKASNSLATSTGWLLPPANPPDIVT